MWRIELLGGVRAIQGDRIVSHFESRKAVSLLAYLAYHRQRIHPREVLAEMLWSDEGAEATRDRLRQALAAIRRVLETESNETESPRILMADRSDVGFCPDAVSTDAEQFVSSAALAAKAAGDPLRRLDLLREAIALYRGDLMPGYSDSWIISERERLSEIFYECLCQAADLVYQTGQISEATDLARRAVRLDPLREEGYVVLMRLSRAEGRVADALRKYRQMERVLREELGVAPSDAAKALAANLCAAPRVQHVATEALPEAEKPATRLGGMILEPVGGAVPLDSPFYIMRPTDTEFLQAIQRNDSIVLVKGARQTGKTSLLARVLQQARQQGARIILTDAQKLTDPQLESPEALFHTLAQSIADQLEMDTDVAQMWQEGRGWNVNFERFMRRDVLASADAPVVWGLDEIDRLFAYPYSKSVFGLFRAWHNERSLDPGGPWSRLTLAIAYATEAYLFISDLNQSPFNVGTRLTLQDFTPGEVADLNLRYGSPLDGEREIKQFMDLVGGHPYLVRRGLYALMTRSESLGSFLTRASRDDGEFGDHLSRTYNSLRQDEALCAAMREVLQGRRCPTPESYYRLHSAGLIAGDSDIDARPRCSLYRMYLGRHLL